MSGAWLGQINDFSAGWANALGRASWQGAVGIVLVWGVCLAFRKIPTPVRCWLWRLVFLKLLAAFLWTTPISLPWLPAKAGSPAIPAGYVLPPTTGPTLPAGTTAAPHMTFPAATTWLFLPWLAGVACCLTRVARQGRTTRSLRRTLVPLTDPVLGTALADLCRQFGIKRLPRLTTGAEVKSPLLIGLLRPIIILPVSLLKSSSPEQVRLMLAHELAHVKRRDLWWCWLPVVTGGVLFFHPLVWLARHEFYLGQEMACDELAVRTGRAGPADYGRMLLQVVEHCPRRPALTAMGVAESYETIERRLTAMKHIHPTPRKRFLAAAVAMVVLGIVGIVPWQLVNARSDTDVPSPAGIARTNAMPIVPGTATITVRARGADGTKPIGSRCVIGPQIPQKPEPLDDILSPRVLPTVTGSDGDWIIHNVAWCKYGWSVSVTGDDFARTPEQSVNVTNGGNLSLSFVLRHGGTLTGRVVDAETGKPIRDASVRGSGSHEVRTDARGRFALAHQFPDRRLSIFIRARDYVVEENIVQVKEGETVAVPDFKLHRGGWISGRLNWPVDLPEKGGVDIRCSFEDGEPAPIWDPVSTEPRGTFRLGPLPSASYRVKAYWSTNKNEIAGEGEVKGIRVEAGQETKDVVIEVKAEPVHQDPSGVTESQNASTDRIDPAHVIIPGTSKIYVQARGQDGARPIGCLCFIGPAHQAQPPFSGFVTGSNGDWVISNVTPGRYFIRLYGATEFAYRADQNTRLINVTNNEDLSVSFMLQRGGTLVGRVLDAETGRPVPGADVVGADERPVRTDEQGRFEFKHAPPPAYALNVWHSNYAAHRTETIQFKEGETVTVPDVKLHRGGRITGRLILPPDAPEAAQLGGAVDVIFEGEPPPGIASGSASIQGNTFQAGPLPSGTYQLRANLYRGLKNPTSSWRGKGEVKGIQVVVGQETRDVVIEVKTTSPAW